ncbi:hypothetical protein H5410_045927 [Solanum commersonii]|uniref:At2g35280-like TPR domain-containing protein n=1 Tax=Solanum commersonii TaxID=4109 RepID=A0A9J5XCY3_SOLCO|nr:hypothetical protein H5410_045927 [Solanum commersonii]
MREYRNLIQKRWTFLKNDTLEELAVELFKQASNGGHIDASYVIAIILVFYSGESEKVVDWYMKKT